MDRKGSFLVLGCKASGEQRSKWWKSPQRLQLQGTNHADFKEKLQCVKAPPIYQGLPGLTLKTGKPIFMEYISADKIIKDV